VFYYRGFDFRQDTGIDGALQTLQSSGTPQYVITSLKKIVDMAKLVTNAKRHIEVAIYPHLGVIVIE